MRPGWLYGAVFTWISLVGGRFLAVFLEDELRWTTSQVGSVLAASQGVGLLTMMAGSGSWADQREDGHPGYGRAQVLSAGILLGGAAFLMHAVLPLEWFAVHISLRLLYAVASAMVFPAMDGMCLEYLSNLHGCEESENGDSRQGYGQERLWGAISWGVTNMILALGLDYFAKDDEGTSIADTSEDRTTTSHFQVMYTMAAGATIGTLLIVYCYTRNNLQRGQNAQHVRIPGYEKRDSSVVLPDFADEEDTETTASLDGDTTIGGPRSLEDKVAVGETVGTISATGRASSALQILQLIGSTALGASFMLAQFTQSSGQVIVEQLVFLYFGDELGSSYTLMGATVVWTVIFEIPIFHLAPRLLERWGPEPLIPLAAISYVTRVFGYSIITNPKHVLWLEPLHGVTYACVTTAGVELVVRIQQQRQQQQQQQQPSGTPSAAASAGQSALQVLTGLGSIFGLIMGGWLQETVGPRIMYRVAGLVVLFGASIFTTILLWDRHGTRKDIHPPMDDVSNNDPPSRCMDLDQEPTLATMNTRKLDHSVEMTAIR